MEYLAYFLLGLSLNLTPCIYPMLTITLSLFRSSGSDSQWHRFLKALVYVSGITVMFTSIGLLAALTGEFFGGFLQSPLVLFVMGLFIIVLSLSMFGLYTFRFPSWLIPQRRTSEGKALIEFFLSGLLVGIVAAPCVGPVVLSLLTAVSQTGDAMYGAVCFLILSLGMGAPYLVLGTFSGLLKKLPKSGSWLVWFERLLAVVLFAFGCFYLIIAFRLPVMQWLIPAAFLGGGIYLGWIENSNHESGRFRIFKRGTGTLVIVAGLLMIGGMFLPSSQSGMVWEKYRPGMLEEARASGQPVILDFYADWCIPCHELDKYTYSDPAVIQAFTPFRRIKVDSTSFDNHGSSQLIREFGIYGVPTMVFLDGNGQEVEEMRLSGFVGSEELLAMMKGTGLLDQVNPKTDPDDI